MKEAIIAKEGMKLIIPSFVLSAVLFIIRFSILTDVLAAIVLFFCLFCVYFFRNPKRHADASPDALIAPADGTITEITDLMEAEFLDNETTRITIFMSPVDVHVNRAPCDGRIARVVHKSGEFAVLRALACSNPRKTEAFALGFLCSQTSRWGTTSANVIRTSVGSTSSTMTVWLAKRLPRLIRPLLSAVLVAINGAPVVNTPIIPHGGNVGKWYYSTRERAGGGKDRLKRR